MCFPLPCLTSLLRVRVWCTSLPMRRLLWHRPGLPDCAGFAQSGIEALLPVLRFSRSPGALVARALLPVLRLSDHPITITRPLPPPTPLSPHCSTPVAGNIPVSTPAYNPASHPPPPARPWQSPH